MGPAIAPSGVRVKSPVGGYEEVLTAGVSGNTVNVLDDGGGRVGAGGLRHGAAGEGDGYESDRESG